MAGYPQPRYPVLKRPESVEELMPRARELVNQPPGHTFQSLKPSYGIEKGHKILFIILSEYDSMVIDAMCRAMREKGAHVDLLTVDSTPVAPPEELAVHEVLAMDVEEEDYDYYYTRICNLLRPGTARALVDLEKYNLLIGGTAGPPIALPVPWQRFNYTSLELFAGPLMDTPLDLITLINKKLFAQLQSSETLRMIDPEGTDVKWTNYDDKRRYNENHVPARPWHIGYGFNGRDDCTGVIAGTLNHLGAFPHLKAYIEGGQVVKLEGGGKYGEAWREKLEKYKDVKLLPVHHPGVAGNPTWGVKDPGFFWFFECAIGTIPGAFRSPREGLFQCFGNFLCDRWRAGYIHNGFGYFSTDKEQFRQTGLPWTHVHIHSIFATLTGNTRSGENIIIVDKGHLTALDDSEVRSLAGKYGDPDDLLREAWFPAIPGINVPGNYMQDYAHDPISWIKQEAIKHPIWID